MKKKLTACIFNYNGFRTKINGKGRIQITIESLFRSFPIVRDLNIIFIDNESYDGSREFLLSLGIGPVYISPRIVREEGWYATTRNNMENLKLAANIVRTPYIWRIEDDSYFYKSSEVYRKAIKVLDQDNDISIIHLRRWTRIDCIDMPGVGRNLNRVSEIRTYDKSGIYYMIEKLPIDSLWIPIEDDLGSNFTPDEMPGYGKCPWGRTEIGSIRKNNKNQYERLLTEKWATYSNHGWIARTDALLHCLLNHDPKSEGDMADAFKKYFFAAKLDEDAFIAFGWRTRYKNWNSKHVSDLFKAMKNDKSCSVKDYGNLK